MNPMILNYVYAKNRMDSTFVDTERLVNYWASATYLILLDLVSPIPRLIQSRTRSPAMVFPLNVETSVFFSTRPSRLSQST